MAASTPSSDRHGTSGPGDPSRVPSAPALPPHLSPDEIAELNRRALTPQAPPGKEPKPGELAQAPPPRSSRGTVSRPVRSYLARLRQKEEEPPLEPFMPWSAYFGFMAGLTTSLMSGSFLPMGIALAFASVALGIIGIVSGIRRGNRTALVLASCGIGLGIVFAWLHGSASARQRPSIPFLYALVNRSKGSSTNYQIEEVQDHFQRIDVALLDYYADNGGLPPHARGNLGANGGESDVSAAFQVPTFKIHVMAYDQFNALTTPIAHLGKYPRDPFAPGFGPTFGYYATTDNKFALLLSPGPDGKYNIDPERDFIPRNAESRERMQQLRWDPTNGTRSGGDLWYICAMPEKGQVDPATGLPTAPVAPFQSPNPFMGR